MNYVLNLPQPPKACFSMLNLQYNGNLLSCPSPLAGWLDKLFKLLEQYNSPTPVNL